MNLLAEKNIIPQENAVVYVKMVKYRNRLVHFYSELTVSEIYNIIQNNLGDFDLFIKDISIFLNRLKKLT
jgi:uncharacterized protein YutE (UPF0331/DUF86 family)